MQFFRANIHNKYNIYYYGFIFCEILNISMAVVAVFLTHRFLNYHFLGYGFKVASILTILSMIPAVKVFLRYNVDVFSQVIVP